MSVDTRPRTNAPTGGLAIIVNASNQKTQPQTLSLSIDDRVICERAIAASSSRRVDCATGAPGEIDRLDLTVPHRVAVTGADDAWTLDALEISTHHGRSTGAMLNITVLPRGASGIVRPGLVPVMGFVIVMFAVMLLPVAAWPRALRAIHLVLCVVPAIGAAAAILAPLTSPYRIAFRFSTVVAWTAIVAARRLWSAESMFFAGRSLGLPAAWKPVMAALIVSLATLWAIWSVVQHDAARFNGNYSGFIHVAKVFYDDNPLVSTRDDIRATLIIEDPGGYDGQFMYFVAFDPLLRKLPIDGYLHVMDEVTYRYGRIGYGWLTSAVSIGDWHRFPTAMMWILMLSVPLGAFALARLAQFAGRSAAWGALFLIIPAFWQSILSCLPESLAAALVVTGYLLWTRGYPAWAAAALAYALLVRETSIVFVLCLLAASWRSPHRRRDVALWLAPLPFVAWRVFLGLKFWPIYGIEGFTRTSPVLGVPFGGITDALTRVSHGEYFQGDPAFTRASILLAVVLAAGLILSLALAIKRPGPVTIAAAVHACMAVSLTYERVWLHVGNAQRVSFEMFVMLAIAAACVPAEGWLRRSLVGFWALTAAFVFWGAYDAQKAQTVVLVLAVGAVLWFALRNRLPRFIFSEAS